MLDLTEFHKLLRARWGALEILDPIYSETDDAGDITKLFELILWPGGKTNESPVLPYMQYDLILTNKYLNYQVIKCTDEDTPGTILTHYKNPSYPEYQYSFIGAAEDKQIKFRARALYNYITTESFKLAINQANIFPTLFSPIQELILNKQDCLERRFFFDIKLGYADNFTEDETDVGVIETTDPPPLREPAVTPPL